MPKDGVELFDHNEILSYDEITRLVKIFASLGVNKIRITGGEPLVRMNCDSLVKSISEINGIEKIAMTTNGMLLSDNLGELISSGLSSVNISIYAVGEDIFEQITGKRGAATVISAIKKASKQEGLLVKLNCVPTYINALELPKLSQLAADLNVALRFIELMPIGEGIGKKGLSEEEVKKILGPMTLIENLYDKKDKCRYYRLENGGIVGFISALSHKFCSECNRIRLTSTGYLKTCLQYDCGVNLKELLIYDDEIIKRAIEEAVYNKPMEHHFKTGIKLGDEVLKMSKIGG